MTFKFILQMLRENFCLLLTDEKNDDARRLCADIDDLQKTVKALNKDIVEQRDLATRNLATWKEYEVGIDKVKPWIEQAETQVTSMGSKPTTLAQATEMLNTARSFEKKCEEYLPKVQKLSHISQQIAGKTVAPDEVDAVYTRWNAVHDTSIQTTTKLDKLVSSWTTFERDTEEFNSWLDQSEAACKTEPNYQTPEARKLEQDLNNLKDLNKVISDRQAQLISLTQVSDHISHGLSLAGATNLKGRVTEMKTRVNKLADTVRHYINLVSDTLLSRQEFQMKISDFENWMTRLRTSIAEISEVNVDNVDTNLQAVHGFLQEHLEKQPNFSTIYEEVKQLAAQGSPEEAELLNQVYSNLAEKYNALEDDLQQRKKCLEKWAELLNWYNEIIAQLSHTKYELEARKPNIADLEKLSTELQTVYSKIETWKDQVPLIDSSLGIHMRDKQGKPLTALALVQELELKAVTLKTDLSTKRDKLANLGARWDNFRQIQHKLTDEINRIQMTLQQITVSVDTCVELAPTIEKIDDLIEQQQRQESDKELLHKEGNNLIKEDQKAMTNVQVVITSVDENWDKVNKLLNEQKKKYSEMDADWRDYQEAREKLSKFIDNSQQLHKSSYQVPNDIMQANVALEKHKRASEVLKNGKQFLDKMEQKSQQLIKEASLMSHFKIEKLENDLSKMRNQYQDTYTNIVEKTQSYETQVIIWKQIEETKYDLTRWLSDTNEALLSACERLIDAENGHVRLARYREELPSYQLLHQGITTKIQQLIKINHNVNIPTLKSLNKLLEDQFKVVNESAQRLESFTLNLNEKEKAIRLSLKNSSDQISKIREDIIKCDDLTGDNTKILGRIHRCEELQKKLEECNKNLIDVGEKIASASKAYPVIERSSLPKELQSLQQRYEGVTNHAGKVSAILIAFLKKLYHEKFSALQRMVTTHKDKVLWCEPEQSSDRYNLEVKITSLIDVEAGIRDCEAKKADTDNFLELLAAVESKEITTALKAERDNVAEDLISLKSNYAAIKKILEHNIALWQRYEVTSENLVVWLKDTETKIRGEGSAFIALEDVEGKIKEIENYQKSVNDYDNDLKLLAELGQDILKVSPESRVAQYVAHLNTRYQAIQKFLSQYLDKLRELKEGRDQYKSYISELETWINNAENKLKGLGEISGPKPMTFYQTRLKELTILGENREKGQVILNKTVEAGEALFPRTTPDQRESIRAELRCLRNRVDNLADSSNVIYKKIENDMMHRSSFEDKYAQVKQWLIDAQAKLSDRQNLLPTLQEKKLALNSYRVIAQDVISHKTILQQLQDRSDSVTDDEAGDMLTNIIEGYENLSSDIEDRIGIAEKHVANHEAYLQTFEKTRDWLNAVINEASPLLEDLIVERDSVKTKIQQIENVINKKAEGNGILQDCNQQLNIIMEQTSVTGHSILVKGFEQQQKIWDDFIIQCEAMRDKLNGLLDGWIEFESVIADLEAWTKQMESRIKDQTLKSTEEAKREYLQKLKNLEEEITANASNFKAAVEKSQGIHAESELATRISKQVTKYQAIKNQAKEAIARYEQFVKEHNTFNERYNQFLNWIKEIQGELGKHCEIVGDLAILQSRQKSIRDLGDTRTKENPRFESIIDLGEKLYIHTSPDGREMVRQQLRNLRTLWDGFTEDLQVAMQKLDQCLMQFAEFSLSQEQLTAWLRDVERDMHQHTELKSTLEEKRAQLQNHKIMHQEIMSHQTLVESVCDKAQRLVDQTKDTSLNVYLQSIKQLFQNIVVKSQDLLDNLEDCADKHNKFNLQCKNLDDWLSIEKEKLLECNDIAGESADISRRLATLAVLKNGQAQGAENLAKLREFVDIVIKSTAPNGQLIIKKEADTLSAALQQHLNEIEAVDVKQKIALAKWQDFEAQLDTHGKWFRTMETAFRDQQLQATLIEKKDRLQFFNDKRDVILKYEQVIEEFVDKSHGLLHSSGIERIKPIISQVSNRYQLLHVLSKDVVNQCQNIVDDHHVFDEKLKAIEAWLTPLEQNLAALKNDEHGGELNTKVSRLKILSAEQDQAESRLASLNAAGERILSATSAPGRETIRYELRQARERWDNLSEGILEQQKKQDAQSLQWTSYQETLQQISAWLDNMERAMNQDSSTAWSTLPEIRSKLLKCKMLHQEILAHKRIVEAISEKANALVQVTQTPMDIRDTVASVSKRYENLINNSQKGIINLERLTEILQQFHDLQNAYQEYQKQQWEKLANYTDYTGNKATLQARLLKVIEIQDGQTESGLKFNVLEEHVKQNAQNLPPRSQESMDRDTINLK